MTHLGFDFPYPIQFFVHPVLGAGLVKSRVTLGQFKSRLNPMTPWVIESQPMGRYFGEDNQRQVGGSSKSRAMAMITVY
jgi:hypothetical protein